MRSSKTIAVLNAVLSNGGDAAILRGMERALRAASPRELRFVVFDSNPDVTASRFPDLELRPALSSLVWPDAKNVGARLVRRLRYGLRARGLRDAASVMRVDPSREPGDRAYTRLGVPTRRALEALLRADAVVSTGGTYLTDTYWLGPRLAAFDAVAALGRPFALYTQSLGPFEDAETRRRLASVFASARLTVLRDTRSADEVQMLAPSARTAVHADAAFGLADSDILAAAQDRTVPAAPHVVFSVREWSHFSREPAAVGMARYRVSVASAVKRVVRSWGGRVTFLSTCQGTPGYRYDDAAVARRIAADLPAPIREHMRVDARPRTPAELISAYGEADLVVATRMHAAILALCAGTPVVPIAYERKTFDLFDRLGLIDWVEDIETTGEIAPTSLADRMEYVRSKLPRVRRELFARVEEARSDALMAGVRTAEALGLC